MQNQDNETPLEQNNTNTDASETDNKAEMTENTNENTLVDKEIELENKVNELNDKYLRLYSEFDNFRRRTVKERADLIKTASEDVLKAMLPIIDDFERAIKANETATNIDAIKEGIQLIYNKLKNTTNQKGLNAFESLGENFNPDFMEAITHIPAASDEQKGKVIDDLEKGYKLGDKVIRFAKVVIAQ
ncbi:MAG: nucleotide exchange factor GrpE [Bacteroidota bacterium]